jgi:hypothetical protein
MINKDKLREILNDETFQNVVEDIIQSHMQAIIYSTDNDNFLREKAYTRIRTTKELVDHMQSIVDSTKIEDAKWKL